MIWPDWQYPHCGTCSAIQAFCNGCLPFRPSIVVTFLPATFQTATRQERIAFSSIWTVQAPHLPEPQPNFVPVSFRCSRTIQSNGVSASASTVATLPFTVNAIDVIRPSPGKFIVIRGFSALVEARALVAAARQSRATPRIRQCTEARHANKVKQVFKPLCSQDFITTVCCAVLSQTRFALR